MVLYCWKGTCGSLLIRQIFVTSKDLFTSDASNFLFPYHDDSFFTIIIIFLPEVQLRFSTV